jgi:putative salt-induced outer membrane protein
MLLTPLSQAAEVKLSDGTVVYGTILSLQDGDDLVVDTAFMGEVSIEWGAIESIEDTQIVEVELYDGTRTLGEVSLDGTSLFVDEGEDLVTDRTQVYSIAEVNETFQERISAYTDVGSNFVRGNSRVSQLSLGAGVSYDATRFKTGLRASSIVNEQTDAPDTRRFTLNADYRYKLDNNWGALGFYQFESDEQQGLDGRSLLGAGFGKRLINQRRHRLEAIGGLAFNVEEFDQSPRNESTEAFLGAIYRLRWVFDADLSYTVYPSLEENGRVRSEFNGSVSMDVLSDLDFKVTLYDRYDSEPPQGNKSNDSGLTVGLSWSY